MLAPKLRGEVLPSTLRDEYFAMFRGYSDEQPTSIWYDEELWLDEWPAKEPDDVGMAYVGVQGDDIVEAVTVTVAKFDGELLVREIEWGRP